ncbi:MAG: alkaline phosphatase family protein [Rikenellaceae bacterium]
MRLKTFFSKTNIKATLFAACFLSINASVVAAPKLVVQIVVSGMRYDYLERFGSNFTNDGFKSFYTDGIVYKNAHYGYMLTTTEAGLATISTGTNPSTHGITGSYWINSTNGQRESLIEDSKVIGIGCDLGVGNYSPANLDISTLGDKLSQHDTLSRVVSIAIDASSAVISGSANAHTYWLDRGRGSWISSTAYFKDLNKWVVEYNNKGYSSLYSEIDWKLFNPISTYKNTQSTIIERTEKGSTTISFEKFKQYFEKAFGDNVSETNRANPSSKWVDFSKKLYTPVGNKILCDFASKLILEESLGKDEHTDLLTICFDSPRYMSEMFGPESIELEDSYYQLDRDLGNLLKSIYAQSRREDVVVVLCSDHGSSNSVESDKNFMFNRSSYMMIMNSFLSAQYEPGDWVLDYNNRQLYLNRTLIYKYGFSLEEIQNKVAAFSLQYRGVSHAITSTALQNGYFGSGYAAAMYNSFYPRRAGDVTINLMPGWIEKRGTIRASSGSLYEYDTHVPLMIRGGKLKAGTIISTDVDMTSIAPSLARIMGIEIPDASTNQTLDDVINAYQ